MKRGRSRRDRWVLCLSIAAVVGSCVVLGPILLGFVMLGIPKWVWSRRTLTITDLVTIVSSLDEYAIKHQGRYPTSLQPLVTPDVSGNSYMEGVDGKPPRDPWGREYHYEPPTPEHPKPHVWSYGADGRLGGTGEDADIDSDQLRKLER